MRLCGHKGMAQAIQRLRIEASLCKGLDTTEPALQTSAVKQWDPPLGSRPIMRSRSNSAPDYHIQVGLLTNRPDQRLRRSSSLSRRLRMYHCWASDTPALVAQ